ncbi:MAG: hypothetical protein N4A72_11305 [Bacteroidales bacterium]|nr:hypothetical protein [Bacteroidales bacterium]
MKPCIKQNTDAPYSIMCIVDIPDNSFNPDFSMSDDIWSHSVNNILYLTYLNLVRNKVINIDYKLKTHKIIFFSWNRYYFIPKINNSNPVNIPLGWFEKKIINAIKRYQPDNEDDFMWFVSKQIKFLVNDILGRSDRYAHPWKKILEKIIINDNQDNWKYKYNKYLFSLIETIDISVSREKLDHFSSMTKELNDYINSLNHDDVFYKFRHVLQKKIHIKIAVKCHTRRT